MDTNYFEAKENLETLQSEARSLTINLAAAVAAGNSSEIIRLKGREKDLPGELFAAEAMLLRADIERLGEAQSEAYSRLREAKENSRHLDLVVGAQIGVLDKEIAKLNSQALTALALPRQIDNEINNRSHEISAARKKLDNLVNSTT